VLPFILADRITTLYFLYNLNDIWKFFLWHCSKIRARTPDSWGSRIIIWHSHKHTPGGNPLNEWSARRRRRILHNMQHTVEKHTWPRLDSTPHSSSWAAADIRLRPLDHWDRPGKVYMPQLRNVHKRVPLFETFDKNSALWDEALCIPVAGYTCFGETFSSIFRKKLEVWLPRIVGKCRIKWRKIQEQVKLNLNRFGQAARALGVWDSHNFKRFLPSSGKNWRFDCLESLVNAGLNGVKFKNR